jgi:tetratricopeptide (TPR) repeat protein
MATYNAFISYSHARDKAIASALQSVLQRLGKAWYERRSLRVFRDDTSLSATPHLWPTIEVALRHSDFFILLASPEAALSPWVNREVEYWLENKGTETLLIAVTQGSLTWDAKTGDFTWNESTPLPSVLKGRFSNEPKWVDLRDYRARADTHDHKFLELVADFAAAIHGVPKEDILSQEVRQQRRALLLAWSTAAVLLALVGITAWYWNSAVAERKIAETERNHAQQSQLKAEKNYASAKGTVDRLIYNITQTIELSQGIRIDTVTRLLDAAKTTIDKLIDDNPDDFDLKASEATMLDEFAKFYVAASDLPRAATLASQSVAINQDLVKHDPANAGFAVSQIQALVRLGQIRFQTGAFGEAEKLFEEALRARDALVAHYPLDQRGDAPAASASLFLGVMRFNRGDISDAKSSFDTALTLARGGGFKNEGFIQGIQMLSLINQGSIYLRSKDVDSAKRVLNDAVNLGHSAASASPDNFILSALTAGAIGAMGDLAFSTNNIELAREAYKEAIELIQNQLTLDPGNMQLKSFAAQLQFKANKLNVDHSNQAAGGNSDQDHTVEILRAAVDRDPASVDSRYNLAQTVESMGDREMQDGNFVGAKKSYEEQTQLAQGLVTQAPDNIAWQLLLARSYEKRGDVSLRLQNPSDALVSYEKEVKATRAGVSEWPDRTEWHALLSISLTKLGDARQSTVDIDGAIAAYEKAVSATRTLISIDQQNLDWQRLLIIGLDKLGSAKSAARQLQEAAALFEEEIQISKSNSEHESENQDWKYLLANALEHKGNVTVELSIPATAQAAYEEEIQLAQSVIEKQPSNSIWVRQLAASLELLGDVHLSTGHLREAQNAYEAGISNARALVSHDPRNSDSQRILASGLDKLAHANSSNSPVKEIEKLYLEEIEIFRGVLSGSQDDEDWNGRLDNTLEALADLKRADGDSEGARAAYQEEADIARSFKDKSPTNAFWHRRFVTAQLNLGDIHFRNTGDPDSAAAFYREGLAAARELAALDPSDALWQKDLILALWRNAQLKQWQSDSLKARELSLEALAIAEHLERENLLGDQAKRWPEILRKEFLISSSSRR